METQIIYHIVMWFGFGLLLLAYTFLSLRKLKPRKIFNLINIFGATGVIISAVYFRDWGLFILGTIWVIVTISTLARLFTPNKEYKDWTY